MVYLDIDFPVLTVFQAIYGLSLTVTACWWWCVSKLYILSTLKANLILENGLVLQLIHGLNHDVK